MSRMLSKMNLISVAQQLPEEDIETIQGYVEMIEEQNQELKEEIKKYQVDRDKTTKFFLNLNDFIKEEIKYCKEIGFECCVEELEKVLKEVEK